MNLNNMSYIITQFTQIFIEENQLNNNKINIFGIPLLISKFNEPKWFTLSNAFSAFNEHKKTGELLHKKY